MVTISGQEVQTPECDKEIAAREVKAGAFEDFLGWIEGKGWKFCHLAVDDRFYPADDALVRRLVPDPPDGGSQELGDWLNDLPGLMLCYHRESNYEEIHAKMLLTEEGRREMRDSFWTARTHPDFWPAGWYTVSRRVEDLLADYFGIDLQASSRERAAILAAIRASHTAA